MNLKKKIKAVGMTQAFVANAMGKSESNFTQMLNHNPTIGFLQELADILGISLVELIADEEELTPTPEEITINGKRYALIPKDD